MTRGHPFARAALIAASALFAIGYPLARAVESDAGVPTFVALSSLFCALAFSAFGRLGARGPAPVPHEKMVMLLCGAVSPGILYLILSASRMVTPSLASVIVISNALIVAAAAGALGRKRFTAPQLLALAGGFAGVVWISVERGVWGGKLMGVAELLVSALLIAAITLAVEAPLARLGWAKVSQWTFWSGAVCSMAAVLALGKFTPPAPGQMALAAFMGAASMSVPAALFNMGMSRLGSADAAAFKLLIPFFALVYAAVALGELPSPGSALAGSLVIASVGFYQYFSARAVAAVQGN